MDNRIYYGEYTLKHWIDLILKRNITLPPYQRSFVWNKEDVIRFMQSLKDKQFVPPVTIAHYQADDCEENYILDGQQRLTSLIIAFIGYFPNTEKFKEADILGSDSDEYIDYTGEEFDNNQKKTIEWTFRELLQYGNTPDEIKKRLTNHDKYIRLSEFDFDEQFFETTFIGFSFIIPDTTDKEAIQHSFSLTFRNINYFGSTLSLLESRKSLYFLNNTLEKFFDGKTSDNNDILCDLKILDNMQPHKIDFVRYLSTLSQYSIRETITDVLKGYSASKSRENYYADYVSYLVGLEQENNNNKFNGFEFNSTFPNEIWKERFRVIKDTIGNLKQSMNLVNGNSFKSWIDADYWLFGLIYIILFKKEEIAITTGLVNTIMQTIESKKRDTNYTKTPNRLVYLRERLIDSINIYQETYEN